MFRYKKFNKIARIIITGFFAIILISSFGEESSGSSTSTGATINNSKDITIAKSLSSDNESVVDEKTTKSDNKSVVDEKQLRKKFN